MDIQNIKKQLIRPDYGKFVLTQIEGGNDFWCLIKALQDDESGFMCNINTIVEMYKEGNLYGLCVNETDSMYQRGARTDDIFCRSLDNILSWYLLPCFCIRVKNTAMICWVHSKYRRLGIGKSLVSLLKIEKAFNPLQDSLAFWKACNIEESMTWPEK